jgi:MFS family permease
MPLPATLRALKYRNFQLFFSGQLISLIGTWMQNVAQSWLVYRLTGSSVLLGLVSFSGQIPVLLFSTLGGIAADRFSRRHVVIATQAASMVLAAALAILTLTHHVQIWHVFVLSALLGVVNAFDIPARQAFIMDMVGREDLINAIALNSAMFNASRVAGPAVAGILVASIGEGWCFFANAVSYIAVLAGLLLMHVTRHERVATTSPLEDVVEGFRFVLHNAPIHALLIVVGVASLAGTPFSVLMPIFADKILHGGPQALGWLMGVSGVGALAGALVLATRKHVRGLGRWVVVAGAVYSVALIGFGYSRLLWLSCALMLPIGFAMMIQFGACNTLIQTMTPDSLRGRVMSVYSMVFMGMAPIGALIAGAVAEHTGAPLALAGGGAICLLVAGGFAMWLPRIRPGARELIVAQGMGAGDPPQELTGSGLAVESVRED